ncbi:DUF6210 family protein [Deinococcus aquaedulcis]|uniref:DUF6210 family protein n=1 Tax=Deinococcus aquaedulcis TaxID=2840455 RepID=UPI001C82844F|nr:DUF6210 family protein [Deinococcus aquaedulcis]
MRVELGLLLDFPAVIVCSPSGVIYAQQACGTVCLQPEQEGFLVPLSDELGRLREALEGHFAAPPYRGTGFAVIQTAGEYWRGIAPETAQWLDTDVLPPWIRVDRQKLRDSYEAWIWVEVHSEQDPLPAFVSPEP